MTLATEVLHHNAYAAEQLCLFTSEELARLRRSSAPQPYTPAESPSFSTEKVDKARFPKGDPIQDRLPGF
jgi:hypothetical protein